jgi:FtsP/CotA-like multicopper oxidase with cupredoxin domain
MALKPPNFSKKKQATFSGLSISNAQPGDTYHFTFTATGATATATVAVAVYARGVALVYTGTAVADVVAGDTVGAIWATFDGFFGHFWLLFDSKMVFLAAFYYKMGVFTWEMVHF